MMREALYAATIAIGIPISAYVGEVPVNFFCIALFLCHFAALADKRERVEMLAVLSLATPLEILFSEYWKIYEYQRGFMPWYVPVGHWFVFDLGRRIAERLGIADKRLALLLTAPFIPATLAMAYSGLDTVGLVLLALLLSFIPLGPAPTLYAVMGWLALIMELWGTYHGVWAWDRNVPWTSLTSWNPPLLVGTFYGFGDLLVNLTTDLILGPQKHTKRI
mmetsp:Transcript_40797/g.107800  ORF Transcript_40797/g.107800 Transcript_40797/m.107800 type:complete len:220 (+) Transcript_40797:55-714(+)